MGATAYVWVLLSVHAMAPVHEPRNRQLVKEYQSTFSTQDKCNAAMVGMNQADPVRSWYCEKHIVE